VSPLRRGALSVEDGETIRGAAATALSYRIPVVLVLASSGADVSDGVASLHGWGKSARALTACSGIVPVVAVVTGPALSGPALLLGIADVVIMTTDAFAFVSGPARVEEFTGVRIGIHQLGGTAMHARSSGLCAIEASSEEDAMAHVAHVLGLLPSHADELAPIDRSANCGRSFRPGPRARMTYAECAWPWPTITTSPSCGAGGPRSW
jgi:acetyl-CoA carboxylase carboxyltransferase component